MSRKASPDAEESFRLCFCEPTTGIWCYNGQRCNKTGHIEGRKRGGGYFWFAASFCVNSAVSEVSYDSTLGGKKRGKKSPFWTSIFFLFLKTDRMWNHCLSTLASCVVLPWHCLQRNVKKTVTQLAIIQRQTGNSNCSHIHLTSTSLKYARVRRETSAGALRLESTRRKRLFSYLQPLMWTRSPVSQTSCRLGWGGWRSQHIPRDSSAAVGGKKKKPHTFHFLLLKHNSVQFGVKQTPSWIYILHQHQVFKTECSVVNLIFTPKYLLKS